MLKSLFQHVYLKIIARSPSTFNNKLRIDNVEQLYLRHKRFYKVLEIVTQYWKFDVRNNHFFKMRYIPAQIKLGPPSSVPMNIKTFHKRSYCSYRINGSVLMHFLSSPIHSALIYKNISFVYVQIGRK